MRCAHSGDPAGDHFAALGDEPEQKLGIFVVNLDGFVGAEHANLPPSEERTPESDGTGGFGFMAFAMGKGTVFVFRHVFIHLFVKSNR